ncbi:MAG TPA: hypothetical protein DC054_17710 [Blastocatellia bacterium]|nr:hypothetical protein [Blastocatellia bacterium]
MIYPHQIPLTERKALSWRLLFLDAVNNFGLALPRGSNAYSVLTSFLNEQIKVEVAMDREQRLNEQAEGKPAGPLRPLDNSLKSAIDNFRATPAFALVSASKPVLPMVNAITTSVNALCCQTCGSAAAICEGLATMKDNGIVSDKGDCIAQLRQMFDMAREAARTYYAAYAATFPVNLDPDIVLSTRHTNSMLAGNHHLANFYASGMTEFVDTAVQPKAEAQLNLLMDDKAVEFMLDLNTYKGILYIMFHECIAHAFQGLLPNFQGRQPTRPYDMFAEGFMDQVAFEVLREVLEKTGLANTSGLKRQIHFPDSLKVTERIRLSRNDCDVNDVATDKAELARGVLAAETILKLIRSAYTSNDFGRPEDFWQGYYRLAFGLNLRRDIDWRKKRDFVLLLYKYHVVSAQPLPSRDRSEEMFLLEIERIVTNYLRTDDIDLLMLEIQNLK